MQGIRKLINMYLARPHPLECLNNTGRRWLCEKLKTLLPSLTLLFLLLVWCSQLRLNQINSSFANGNQRNRRNYIATEPKSPPWRTRGAHRDPFHSRIVVLGWAHSRALITDYTTEQQSHSRAEPHTSKRHWGGRFWWGRGEPALQEQRGGGGEGKKDK